MKIAIVGPIATDSIIRFLDRDAAGLPCGYYGAPLLGTLLGALLGRGHVVTAFTTSSDIPLEFGKPVVAEEERFKIVYCPSRSRAFRYSHGHWGRAADAFRLERNALSRAMQEERPDVIHAHWTYEFALAALDTGYPHVITCHDAPQVVLRYIPNAYRLVRYFMAKRVLARARCLTAVSPYLQNMVEGYATVPVTVVPNPLPDGIIGATKRVHQYDPTHPRISMVLNGWGKRKNPQAALRAFALLRQKIPGAELHAMGTDFGTGEKAESWARSHGLHEGVYFLGRLPYSDILANLSKSDLLLHTSLEETFGMSIAEAMALGVPVVGGENSGAVSWVIGKGGVTTNVTSPPAIYETMQNVLNDRSLHARLVNSSWRDSQERFSSGTIVDSYETIYTQLLDKN